MDKFGLDSHKLTYHVDRLCDWKEGRTVYPVYIEVSPSGSCNHRCVFCAYDFVGYAPRFLDAGVYAKRVAEMGRLGVRSILFSGEGEPLLNKDLAAMVRATRRAGIDAALASNGVLMKKEFVDAALKDLTWVKISFNAGTAGTYAKIHRARSADFRAALDNIAYAAKVKRARKLSCTIGMQILLLPDNKGEVARLARLARDIGADYLVVKPYSQHPRSKTRAYQRVRYDDGTALQKSLERFNTKDFDVIVRVNTMRKWNQAQHPYRSCMALPFWAHIDSAGNVWGCPAYFGDKRFLYGNIMHQSFKDVWQGPVKARLLKNFDRMVCIDRCRVNCRMDEVNRFLWRLKHPPEHVNFV